ncbi:MAG: DNA polymerase III subunit alpha [Actinobacteria bacterium]|nr:DNA polymerase III subunit alpha [Actinomycetota bacterium]
MHPNGQRAIRHSGYFLIVSDFVGWAKAHGIRVGPGRGSVGGSIVAYALGITELDPLRWNLGFERFLNPGRKSMPDIDIDFDERRRGEVIRYVTEKYGEDRVAQIITFSTIKAKAAIRDAARVLGFPYAVGDRLAKMYPPSILGKDAPFVSCFQKDFEWPSNTGKNQAYDAAAELRKAYETDDISRQVIDTARKLEDLRRQHSVHAAGVVIGHEPLTNHVPVQKTDGETVTQYEMTAIEKIGLLKMDFLGLRNLTVIGDAVAHIKVNRGDEVDVDNLALDDPKAYVLLQNASSAGIFQMESGGMTRLLKSLKPDRFEEIAALIALYRPGPMEEIPRYVKGKHSPSSVTYFHPLLETVLTDTNGVIVYVAYQTAWLKAHYPVEFMAALLTSVKDKVDKMPIYLAESRAMAIKVQPPNVNESMLDFTPRGDEILFGLSAIRNVGEQVAERIIEARSKGSNFRDFHDFLKRVDPSCLNRKVMESLAKAGAFDAMGIDRNCMLAPDPKSETGGLTLSDQATRIIETVMTERRSEDAGQFSLFAGQAKEQQRESGDAFQAAMVGLDIAKADLLTAEKEMLGFYVSEHPLAAVESALRYQSEIEIPDIAESPDGSVKTIGGILSRMTRKFTKKGDLWFTGTLEDMLGSIEVIFWNKTVNDTAPDLLKDDQIVLIKARIEVRDESAKLVALHVSRPDLSGSATPLRIKMAAAACRPDRLEELKVILQSHPGPSPVLLHLLGSGKTTVLKLGGFSVELRNGLFAELKAVLGPEALV